MNTKVVYRLVGRDGRGVYYGGHAARAGISCYASPYQPPPCREVMRGIEVFSRPAFAFESLESLRSWFVADDRVSLSHIGVTVKKYEVPVSHVVTSSTQCVFNKRVAKVVGELDLVHLC